jgi:predicted nucleic-acid-binding Zn-ribbon protein
MKQQSFIFIYFSKGRFMKKTGKCPKCESTNIIVDAKAVDHGHGHSEFDMEVAQYGNPGALFFKDKHSSSVSAWVCADCGYVEYYADTPKKIVLKKHRT